MQKRIFITGGASGLGYALAQRCAASGWQVCIADFDVERAEAILPSLRKYQPQTRFIECDVTRMRDLERAAAELEAAWGGVDVVVNNAGVAYAGPLVESSLQDWQWIIDINLMGVVRGCKAFLPMLKKQNHGHIVNVASLAGLLDVPNMSAYNATKSAVVSLSETLENELVDDNIKVTVVCPSFFRTNLGNSLRSTIPGMGDKLDRLMAKSKLNADDVAQHILKAIEKGKTYSIPHRQGRIAWRLKRFLPRSWYRKILHKS